MPNKKTNNSPPRVDEAPTGPRRFITQHRGPSDKIAADSRIVHQFLPDEFARPGSSTSYTPTEIFSCLHDEVHWHELFSGKKAVQRLVCTQGAVDRANDCEPIYRHVADQVPPISSFSPFVEVIRKRAEELCGHPLNHALIQLYRGGGDHIGQHSDKTLDIVRSSSIVNVSFGAERTMTLTEKSRYAKLDATTEADLEEVDLDKYGNPLKAKGDKKGQKGQKKKGARHAQLEEQDSKKGPMQPLQVQEVTMPHNSMFIMGPETNKRWFHAIHAQQPSKKGVVDPFGGARISLTFRHIGTFTDHARTRIWGQGATSKTHEGARPVVNNNNQLGAPLLKAFGLENQDPDFDWDKEYGRGFDVLHFRDSWKVKDMSTGLTGDVAR
ncbi:hypothetical protein F5B20DRAFT_578219 [Whalleya microplaca]|nr:hypothetical protein F5B20DRAFT_578219 [Whalleya microplaca]